MSDTKAFQPLATQEVTMFPHLPWQHFSFPGALITRVTTVTIVTAMWEWEGGGGGGGWGGAAATLRVRGVDHSCSSSGTMKPICVVTQTFPLSHSSCYTGDICTQNVEDAECIHCDTEVYDPSEVNAATAQK